MSSAQPGQASTPGDVATPETFKTTVTFGQFMKRGIVTLVLLFLISAVLFGLVRGWVGVWTGVPGLGYVGVVLAVPFCLFMLYAKKRQFDEKWGQQAVTFSSTGAVMSDRDTRVELPWTRVQSIGEVQLMAPVRTPGVGDKVAVAGVYSILTATQGTREHGLVGAGLLATTPEAPMLVKMQVKQFLTTVRPIRRSASGPWAFRSCGST